jgi:hypothetical protein
MEEKMNILRLAVEKLDDEAQAILIQVLLRSPLYASAQPGDSDQEGDNNVGVPQDELALPHRRP